MRTDQSHLQDRLLSPPSYHETINHQQQQLPNQYPILSNDNINIASPTNDHDPETPSRRHPYQAIIITSIIVGGIIIIALIVSFTLIFVKRSSIIPPTTTTTTTTTKRPICFDGDGLLIKEDGSRIKIRDVKISDEVLVAYQGRNKQIQVRSSPILPKDIFQKYQNHSPINFLQIEVESNVSIKSLTITPKHSLLIKKKDQLERTYHFADQVQVGDYLYLMNNDSHATGEVKVARINDIKLFDAYAPLTFEGTLIVNDVIVSCYGTFKHSLVHSLMIPRRWLLYYAYQITFRTKRSAYIKEDEDVLEDLLLTIDIFRLSIRNRILDLIYLFKY